jgi:hypothetical protein
MESARFCLILLAAMSKSDGAPQRIGAFVRYLNHDFHIATYTLRIVPGVARPQVCPMMPTACTCAQHAPTHTSPQGPLRHPHVRLHSSLYSPPPTVKLRVWPSVNIMPPAMQVPQLVGGRVRAPCASCVGRRRLPSGDAGLTGHARCATHAGLNSAKATCLVMMFLPQTR